jgi:hypothetical protein
MFAAKPGMWKSILIEKATPLIRAHFGNKDDKSAERTILHGISLFSDRDKFPESGFSKVKLEKVA